MTTRLVDAEWSREVAEALRVEAGELRIISPFIKAGALARLLSAQPKDVSAITRFNLADFAEGVSDTAALRRLLECGATVRGVKNLHAKLYLFGSKRAIVTSANLTEAALDRNHEFGLVSEDANIIAVCRRYFDDLWRRKSVFLRALTTPVAVAHAEIWPRWQSEFWDREDQFSTPIRSPMERASLA